MKKIIILLPLLLLIFFSCNNNGTETPKGSIFVTVRNNFEVVPDAIVTTEPISGSVTTDITGTAIMSNVPIGGYKVKAFHPSIGSGSASITVTSNSVRDVTINLIAGLFENPSVEIQQPIDENSYGTGEDIIFSANVSDSQDQASTLLLEWSSDVDGVLNTGHANAQGFATFTTNTLSEGDHIISLKATDSSQRSFTDQVSITVKILPQSVTLNQLSIEAGGLLLDWTVSTEATFTNYRIYRSENPTGPYSVIGVISDLNTLTYMDTNVTFGTTYYYQVGVVLANGDESRSNVVFQTYEGQSIDIGVNVVRMVVDPVRPYIYALDKINNSLLFINTDTKTIDKTIFVGSAPTDIDINFENTKAYVANFGSTQISIIDLDSQVKINDIFVDTQAGSWDGNPHRLACLAGNKLAYTSEDQWNSVKMVNMDNGAFIASASGSIYEPGLLTNAAGSILFVAESGSSGSSLFRFNVSSNALTEIDESDSGSSWGHRDACISGNDTYIFHRKTKYLASNLSSNLGTFSENIIECNNDGSIAIGEENIWNSETFSIIRPLPVSSTIIRLDSDDSTLYIYDVTTSKIYITTID